jgi:TonB-linked SusC/RagA family outer membrane protein
MIPHIRLVTVIICFICTSQLYGQKKVTLDINNKPVPRAIEIINEKYKIPFIYIGKLLEGAHNVTIHCVNASLEEVLDTICNDQSFTYAITNGKISLRERTINITGIVRDEQDQVAPGVTVLIRHTGRSAISHSNGTFFLNKVPIYATLIAMAPDMKTDTIPVNNTPSLSIKLKWAFTGLPPVTVTPSTGFRKMNISLAVSSVSIVDSEMLKTRITRSLEQALEGSVTGMLGIANKTAGINQPRYFQVGPTVTLNGNPDPLIILDQFVYNGDLSDLNLDDIESVVVLKDASVASIWGARGGNGVVVITSKKGKYADALKISLNSYVTGGLKPDPFYKDAVGPAGRINIDTFLFGKNYTRTIERNNLNLPLSPALELLIRYKKKQLTLEELNDQLNFWRNYDVRNEVKDLFYREPVSKHLWGDITGGNHKYNIRLSFGYDAALPAIRNSRSDRKTGSISVSTRPILNIIEISAGVYGSRQEQHNTENDPLLPAIYHPITDANGASISQPFRYRQYYMDSIVNRFGLPDWNNYPKNEFDLYDQTLTVENLRLQGNVILKAPDKFLKGLEASFSTQYQLAKTELRNLKNQQTFFVRDLVNHFTLITPGGLEQLIHWGNILDLSTTKIETHNTRWQLSYLKNWSSANQFSIMAGVDRTTISQIISASKTYDFSELNPDGQSNIDYNKKYALSFPGSSAAYIPSAQPEQRATQVLISYFSSAGFNFKKQFNFSLTTRYDRSNIFGLLKNQNYIPLVAGGISWDVHLAPWYRFSYILQELKLRTTYGGTGNIAGSATMFPTVTPEGLNSADDRMSSVSNPPLRTLKWEAVKTLNFGVNFKFIKNIISGSIDYYHKTSSNLLEEIPIDPSTGDNSVLANSAIIKARQVDVVVNSQILKKTLLWNARLLLSLVSESVTKTSSPLRDAWEYCENGYVRSIPEYSPYDVYSFKSRGLDNEGNPIGVLNDHDSKQYGQILSEKGSQSLIHHGRGTPGIYGSITNEFEYRRFSVTFAILYKLKYFYRRHSIFYNETFTGESQGSRDFEKRWKTPGDEQHTNVPSMIITNDNERDLFYKYSNVLVEKADHIRLQYVHLNYALKPNWLPKHVSSCSIYINANNLGILWRAGNKDVDPDQINGLPDRPEASFGVRLNLK